MAAAMDLYRTILNMPDGHEFDQWMAGQALLAIPNLPEDLAAQARGAAERLMPPHASPATPSPTATSRNTGRSPQISPKIGAAVGAVLGVGLAVLNEGASGGRGHMPFWFLALVFGATGAIVLGIAAARMGDQDAAQ